MAGHANSLKAILFALASNVAIFASKLLAAFLTGSGTMLSEAIHSLADCGNQGLLLVGMRQSRRPASEDYPLGWGRVTYFWSFLVSLLLFSLGGLFSIYSGIHKLLHPEPLKWLWLALGVLTFSIAAESFSMYGCLREVNKARGNRGLWQWFHETRSSELLVIFGEDFAALTGLGIAIVAISATLLTGNLLFDALGTLSIGVLLVLVAIIVAIEIKALLVGQSIEPERRAELLDFLKTRTEITEVLDLISLQIGPDVMVAVKVRMIPMPSDHALTHAIHTVNQAIKTRFGEIRWSFLEPETKNQETTTTLNK